MTGVTKAKPPGRPGRSFPWLLVQLVAANIAVAGTVLLVVYWAFSALTNMYFDRLMEEFDISPTELNAMFVDDLERTLLIGIALALAVGFALSLFLTRAILRPLGRMAQAATSIGGGDLTTRVAGIRGELEPLAWHFNAMAGALERQEESRKQLMRDLSHELRTPLTNLKGYLEGLEDGVFRPDPQVLRVLRDEVARLNTLIGDLTLLSSAEEIATHLAIEDVDLLSEIDRTFTGYEGAFIESGLTFEIERPMKSTLVRADRQRLRQVLDNIVANAVQHSAPPPAAGGDNPTVRVRFETDRNEVVAACFENAAAPLSDAQLARIFDRFYRLHHTRVDGSSNAGLGLSIVKRLIEAQGGSVSADYRSGRFRLRLEMPSAG